MTPNFLQDSNGNSQIAFTDFQRWWHMEHPKLQLSQTFLWPILLLPKQKKHLSEKLGSDETFHQIGRQVITPDVLPGDALFDELGSLLPEVQVIWWSWMGGWQLEVSSLDLGRDWIGLDSRRLTAGYPKLWMNGNKCASFYIWNGHWAICVILSYISGG